MSESDDQSIRRVGLDLSTWRWCPAGRARRPS